MGIFQARILAWVAVPSSRGSSQLNSLVSIIKWWRQPDKTRDEMLQEHEKKLDNDHKRLQELEESNKIMMQSMLALMSHAIDGNHIEDLRQARDDLQKYLIRR